MRAKRNMNRWAWLFDKVSSIYGANLVTGGPEIGVEIEVEGKELMDDNPQYYWKVAHDGSLRVLEPDDRAVEYVFRKPLDRATTLKALEYLEKKLADATIFESDRTSVHIHLNASDLPMIDVYKWLTLYFIFEPVLQKYCGDSRMGNHFALAGVDSDFVVTSLVNSLKDCQIPSTNNDMRYAACNYTALGKFGTLEFRAHEGTVSSERIWKWISILLAIKDAAISYPNPKEIVGEFSRRGPMDFAEVTFGRDLMEILPINGADLFEGARLAQEIAYGFEWEDAIEFHKTNKREPAPRVTNNEWVINAPPPPEQVGWPPQPARVNIADVIERAAEQVRNEQPHLILDEEDQ